MHEAPILRAKQYDAPSVFLPENMLREARRQKGLTLSPVPDICVLDQPFVEVFALAGGALHRAALARGVRVHAWTDLSEVVKALQDSL